MNEYKIEERWDIIKRIEKHREIADYFAKLRCQVIDNAIPNIIVTQDKQGNLVDIKQKHPPHVEKALKEIEELGNLALDKKKTTNHYVRSKNERTII